jgi:P4 family phage/plasmid primase-like protien
MIQILGLRPYIDRKTGKEKLSEKFFEEGWRAESIEDILENYPQILNKIPLNEQWNLYFTVADCHEEKGRKLKLQHHIAIDIDGMHIKENTDGTIDESCFTPVIEAFEKITGLSRDQVGILFSGHGLWFYIRMASPISDDDYFRQTKQYYKLLCDKLNLEFKKRYLQCKTDPTAWSGARLSRMPGTKNIKKDKPERKAYVIQANIVEIGTDIKKLCGATDFVEHHHVNIETLRKDFPPADVKEILHPERGCNFLYQALTNPKDMTETEWFYQCGITGRFPDGRKITHEMSKGHPNYTYEETELKLDHALLYGPRTCKGVAAISDKCKNCKHHNTKLKSPIMIRGEDYIDSEPFGFHKPKKTDSGLVPGKPDPDGLARYYIRENTGIIHVAGVHDVWVYNGMYYKQKHYEEVQAALDSMYKPPEPTALVAEAYKKICFKTIRPRDFFKETVQGKANFKNGILDVHTRDFIPHDPEYGFTSVLNCEYDSMAIAPRWEAFLNEVLSEDVDLIKVVQEFIGYSICEKSCKHEKALFLLGTGSNGKTVFVRVIKDLFGKESCSDVTLSGLQNDQNIPLLEGKLVNIAEENDASTGLLISSTFKNLISGGTVTAKNVYERPYPMESVAKFIFLLNELPKTKDATKAFFRRQLIIPFNKYFSDELGNKDPDLINKLKQELPGIMNWALQGYDRLKTQGRFTDSKTIDKYVKEYQRDASDMLRFISDCVVLDEDATTTRDEIYKVFRDWADAEAIDATRITKQKIYSVLRGYYRETKGHSAEEPKLREDGDLKRGFKGLKVTFNSGSTDSF